MRSLKSLMATFAVVALILAACAPAGERPGQPAQPEDPGAPAPEQPVEQVPAEEPENELTEQMAPETEATPDVDTTPDAGGAPDPAVEEPAPAATPEPTEAQALTPALAIIDHMGSLTVLQDGRCEWTNPDASAGPVPGQPGEGSTAEMQWNGTDPGLTDPAAPTEETETTEQLTTPEPATEATTPEPATEQTTPEQATELEPLQPTDGASLQLTIELRRGFAPPAEEEAEEETETTPEQPIITSEQMLPFTLLPEQVQLTLQLPEQPGLGQPEVWTGSAAPNGLSGYIVARVADGQVVTINFVCAVGADETPELPEREQPELEEPEVEEPAVEQTPAIEPSPSP